MVGERQLIGDVDDVASYAVSHNSADVLRRRSSSPSVIKSVGLIRKETEGHACRHLETMGESINPAFHTRVVIEYVAVEVAELGCVLL